MSKDQHERMDVEFHFEGGPRAGTNKAVKVRKDRWLANPGQMSLGCVTEAHAVGMHGVYLAVHDRLVNGKPVLVWKNVQPLAVLGT